MTRSTLACLAAACLLGCQRNRPAADDGFEASMCRLAHNAADAGYTASEAGLTREQMHELMESKGIKR